MKLSTLALKRTGLLCLAMCILQLSFAKQIAVNGIFSLTNSQSYTELPFRLLNNLIVVPILVNGEKELNFILDSGTHSPIILNDRYTKDIEMNLSRDVRFQGAGNGKLVEGKVISSMSLQIGDAYAGRIGGILLDRNPLSNLYLEDVKIHGIIGATIFRSFAVEIDYITRTLRLHSDQGFLDRHTYSSHEMEIEFSRPLLRTEAKVDGVRYPLTLMIDTGFNNKLLIYEPATLNFKPRRYKHIGKGYSGNVKASSKILNSLKLADRQLFNVNTYFPSSRSYKKENESLQSVRDGIIGNELLKQFCVVMDYANGKFYLQEHLLNKPALAQDPSEEEKSNLETP